MKISKKFISCLLAMIMAMGLFAGCSDEEAAADEYAGVLTKVRLGMPMAKVIKLNSGVEMYYDSDTVLWCINPDTDLMELQSVIPADDGFYNVDESLITYNFRGQDEESYLTGYTEEITCMIDRETATKYYEDKKKRLMVKYGCKDESASSTITGTEDVDLTLDYQTKLTMSSFDLVLTMRLTYDTVNGVEGYYATYYSIDVNELRNKSAVPDSGSSKD
ncbi:MAG: hypothetical protein K2K57_12735 [Oscillospiraceae bacterium]|nr:hypothetical protein [Oscillospiraceae bacterium]